MIRAVIADDEKAVVDVLSRLLEATGSVTVVGQAATGTDCLRVLEETEADVLLLDVAMPGLTGVEVAEIALDLDDPPLIAFITAHDDYAVKAFELGAIDYVVKPIGMSCMQARIAVLVERVEEALAHKEAPLEALRQTVAGLAEQQPSTVLRKLPIKDYEEGTIRLIDPAEVVCIGREGRRVVLKTTRKAFATYYTVDRLERRLASAGFLRANPGALINVDYIDHLIPNGDGSYDAVLSDGDGTVIPVSRSRAQRLLELLRV